MRIKILFLFNNLPKAQVKQIIIVQPFFYRSLQVSVLHESESRPYAATIASGRTIHKLLYLRYQLFPTELPLCHQIRTNYHPFHSCNKQHNAHLKLNKLYSVMK